VPQRFPPQLKAPHRAALVETELAEHGVRARHLAWLKSAAEGKAGPGRYGSGYELLIAVEDWWFDEEQYSEPLVTS
jgi:hypothetical protein